ncbi:MAG: hypothetical protein J6C46_04165 [Clostridia bacterium]|nr:hypothetical protein [Clostridia bacterium]
MNLLKKYKKMKIKEKMELLDLLLDDLQERFNFKQKENVFMQKPNLYEKNCHKAI